MTSDANQEYQIENDVRVSIELHVMMVTRVKFERTRNAARVSTAISSLPNFHECYHNSMETQGKRFLLFSFFMK